MTKKKERFFITGGMGYIGSAFAQEALRRGHDVCLYDALIYEQNRERLYSEIAKEQTPGTELQFIVCDTRNTELLLASVKKFQPTYFMHWGDLSSVYSCNHNPVFTEDICYNASRTIVDMCAELGIKLFFNSSSSTLAFFLICCTYVLNSGSSASLNATALAAITFHEGRLGGRGRLPCRSFLPALRSRAP